MHEVRISSPSRHISVMLIHAAGDTDWAASVAPGQLLELEGYATLAFGAHVCVTLVKGFTYLVVVLDARGARQAAERLEPALTGNVASSSNQCCDEGLDELNRYRSLIPY